MGNTDRGRCCRKSLETSLGDVVFERFTKMLEKELLAGCSVVFRPEGIMTLRGVLEKQEDSTSPPEWTPRRERPRGSLPGAFRFLPVTGAVGPPDQWRF
jgi:hypothetical protein